MFDSEEHPDPLVRIDANVYELLDEVHYLVQVCGQLIELLETTNRYLWNIDYNLDARTPR